jgi:hypothetical protein
MVQKNAEEALKELLVAFAETRVVQRSDSLRNDLDIGFSETIHDVQEIVVASGAFESEWNFLDSLFASIPGTSGGLDNLLVFRHVRVGERTLFQVASVFLGDLMRVQVLIILILNLNLILILILASALVVLVILVIPVIVRKIGSTDTLTQAEAFVVIFIAAKNEIIAEIVSFRTTTGRVLLALLLSLPFTSLPRPSFSVRPFRTQTLHSPKTISFGGLEPFLLLLSQLFLGLDSVLRFGSCLKSESTDVLIVVHLLCCFGGLGNLSGTCSRLRGAVPARSSERDIIAARFARIKDGDVLSGRLQ